MDWSNHDHNPSPVVNTVRLKRTVCTRYDDLEVTIPEGTYGYIDDTVEFDERPGDYYHCCVFFVQNDFIPPKNYAGINAWCFQSELEMLGFKNLYGFKQEHKITF